MRGLVVGIVTNIDDPDQMGRVKVRFPWLDGPDQAVESHWARVTGWYAGNSRGTMQIPEVGDEVMVAFGHGDPNHPYVIGAVWNGEHAVPGPGNPDGKNDHKWFRSRAGHDFEFLDTDGGEKIRLVDSSTNNSMVIDTPADTITTEAKTGTINIQAPKGHIQVDCVDLVMKTTEGRNLEVGTTHTVTVGQNRTVGVSKANLIQLAGNSLTVTTPTFKSSTGSAVGVSAGALAMNQGTISTEVKGWSEVQQGPVTRTVGSQKVTSDDFRTLNTEGTPSGPLTILAGNLMTQADGGIIVEGSLVTVMAGMLNGKGGSMLVAKDGKGGKAALSTWLGGLLLLNPNTLTFPATKLLDPILGMDFHTTLPSIPVPPAPPLPPLPLFPAPFAGPILIDFKPTVLINFRPAAGSGATALSFHMPPLPWPWPPISHRPLITAAIMALMTAPFTALLEMGRAKVQAMAAASNNETFQRGFVADVLGSSHVQPTQQDQTKGKSFGKAAGNQGTFSFTRLFPMFSSAQAFLGFLAGLAPLPIANASVTIASPTTTVCDAPLGMMIPLGANSCSDIPIVPNAAVVGFSNVLTGMSIGDFLGQLAWNAIQGAATMGFQAGVKKAGNAAARRIARSNNPRLQNVAQRVNDFVGGDNCIAEGHPVDVVSGTMFSQQTDIELFGAQSFAWGRFYNSRSAHLPGDPADLGPGWRHVLDEWLIADEDDEGVRTLAYRNHEGRVLGFDMPLVDGEDDFHPLDRLTLKRVDGRTYEIHQPNGTVRRFRFPGGEPGKPAPPGYTPGVGNRAPLAALVEPMGGEGVRPRWKGSRLVGFTDACGREVVCSHDPQGRLTGLRLVSSTDGSCDIFLAAYEFDADGRLARHIDANRNIRRFAYDAQGRMVRETDRNGYSFHFQYDADDRCVLTHGDDNSFWTELEYVAGAPVTIARDALGGVTRYKHDPDLKKVVEIHDAEGGIKQTTYTDEGWVESEIDPVGNVSSFEYDARGRATKVVDANGGTTAYAYDSAGRLSTITDAMGGETRLARDGRGLIVESISPAGRVRRIVRDGDGRPVAVVIPDGDQALKALRAWHASGVVAGDTRLDGVRVRYQVDALGRITTLTETGTDGQRRARTYTRDAMGRVVAIEGPLHRRERFELLPEGQPTRISVGGRTARRRYEGWGRLVEHVDPIGRATRIDYDLHHKVLRVHLAGDRTWHYHRDRLGRVTRMQTPDGVAVDYGYDAAGQMLTERRADRTITREYDAVGRVTAADWGRGQATQYTYDSLGRLTAADGAGEEAVAFAYDPDGYVITETVGEHVQRHRHDAMGRRTHRHTALGRERFEYDAAGLVGLTDAVGGQHRFTRDGFGRRVGWHQPGGVARRHGWDALDRLTDDALELPGGALAVDRRLTWTEDDTVSAIDERYADSQSGPRNTRHAYQYDAAGRLTGWARDGGPTRAYTFDAADNLLAEPGGPDRSYAADRLVADANGGAYRYDGDGRLIAIERPSTRRGRGGTERLWFDARDRLVRVHTADDRVVEHRYDALGRRVETLAEQPDGRATLEQFAYDGHRLSRRVVRDLATEAVVRDETYTHDPEYERPLFRVVRGGESAPGELQYYTTDQRGAVTRLTAADGRALWIGRADPYGRYHEEGPERGQQPLRLAGQVADAATGLCHHRFRVYDPRDARFVSPDPLGLAGGTHAFGYPVDPIAYADPLGLAKCKGDADSLVNQLDDDVYFHYTDKAGFDALRSGNPETVFRPNSKNRVYATQDMYNPTEVEQYVFIGNPQYAGKGDYLIAFRRPAGATFGPGHQPNEVIHRGTLRVPEDNVIYAGTNPFD